MMRIRRIFSAVLAVILSLSLVPASGAEQTDWLIPKARSYQVLTDTRGTEYEAAARACCETGLMDAVRAGKFLPEETLSYAQVIVICARLHKLLTGGKLSYFDPISQTGAEWYAPYQEYLRENVPDCPLLLPEDVGWSAAESAAWSAQDCLVVDFVELLGAVVKAAVGGLPDINHLVKAQAAVSLSDNEWMLYNAGILRGINDYGVADNAGHTITRGEAALPLLRIIDPSQRMYFTLRSFDICKDALGVDPDTVLFIINGENVTAGQCALHLANGIVVQNWGEGYMLKTVKNVYAVRLLAAQRKITLSQEEKESLAIDASEHAGVDGAGETARLWSHTDYLLHSKVKSSFPGLGDPHNSSPAFIATLNMTVDSLSFQTTAEYEALDLVVFRDRLVSTGVYSLVEYTGPGDSQGYTPAN